MNFNLSNYSIIFCVVFSRVCSRFDFFFNFCFWFPAINWFHFYSLKSTHFQYKSLNSIDWIIIFFLFSSSRWELIMLTWGIEWITLILRIIGKTAAHDNSWFNAFFQVLAATSMTTSLAIQFHTYCGSRGAHSIGLEFRLLYFSVHAHHLLVAALTGKKEN